MKHGNTAYPCQTDNLQQFFDGGNPPLIRGWYIDNKSVVMINWLMYRAAVLSNVVFCAYILTLRKNSKDELSTGGFLVGVDETLNGHFHICVTTVWER